MAKKTQVKSSVAATPRTQTDKVLLWGAVVLTVILSAVTVYYWRAGYSSDTILTGLMAKNVVLRGERPIFLWYFGYHGIIPHVYITALFFKLFGVGPHINLIFTIGAWWLGQYVTFKYIDAIWGRRVASLTAIVLAVSSVEFYTKVVRPEPGYTETMLLGMLLLFWVRRIIDKQYVQRIPCNREALITLAGAGFFAGFGFYVYQLMIYFIGAVILQLGLVAMREALQVKLQGLRRWGSMLVADLGVLFLTDGVRAFFTKSTPYLRVGDSVFLTIGVGLAAIALAIVAALVMQHGRALLSLVPMASAVFLGAVVGYAPKLYFKYVLHGVSQTRTDLDPNLDMFIKRLQWAYQNTRHFLNVEENNFLSDMTLVAWIVLLVLFAARELHRWYTFVRGRTEPREALRLDAITLLPYAVLPAYALSAASFDFGHSRYTIVLYLFYALSVGVLVDTLSRRAKPEARYAGWALAAFLLAFNAQHMAKEYERWNNDGFDGEDVVAAMRERDIHYGYADYWAAYAITFFTDEDITLQPLYSAYAPAYGPIVAQAKRLAVIVRAEKFTRVDSGPRRINNMLMDVVDSFVGDKFAFVVLESQDEQSDAAQHAATVPR